jgi:hypothetical protein
MLVLTTILTTEKKEIKRPGRKYDFNGDHKL